MILTLASKIMELLTDLGYKLKYLQLSIY